LLKDAYLKAGQAYDGLLFFTNSGDSILDYTSIKYGVPGIEEYNQQDSVTRPQGQGQEKEGRRHFKKKTAPERS
jgi:hypothetical protein